MKFIDSDKSFNNFLLMLEEKNVTELAVDFELECNLHCYGNHVCLIQIFDGEETYLLDPLKISAEKMKPFLENEKILKTGFSMNSDIKILSENLRIKMSPLFDVSMIAQVVYGQQVGLDFLLKEVLKIEIKDKKKWQMNNWMRRPISKDALEYAAGDVKYLFTLKDELLKIAEEKKLKKMILNGIKTKKWNYETSKIPSFFTKKMFLSLSKNEKHLCEKIFYIREDFAKKLNIPAANVFDHKSLIEIVKSGKIENTSIVNRMIPEKTKSEILENIRELLKTK